MAPTIFIKFCGFIIHSNPKNIALSAVPGKILLIRKIFFTFLFAPNIAPKPTDQSCSNFIFRVLLQLSTANFRPSLNIKSTLLRVVHIKNKKRPELKTWNFTNVINCFCCYVIKTAGETARKVLLSYIWNLPLIEINLSQIRISHNKREKVCAVCPHILFLVLVDTTTYQNIRHLFFNTLYYKIK